MKTNDKINKPWLTDRQRRDRRIALILAAVWILMVILLTVFVDR